MTSRRDFVQGALATGALLLGPRTSRAAEARIDVLADEVIGTISSNIYGHFVEHLGGVVYDGIWVGEGSKVPNIGGVRRALVEHMRRIKPGVVRWPGGCFADMYNWRDGIGPRDKRPRRTNFWRDDRGNRSSEAYRQLDSGPQKYEPNWFGTNEFMAFCRQIETRPYFAANVRSLPAQDFQEWVEYCNAPAGTTTLADLRAAAGDRDPYRVEFWGVGNESWGCGGRLTPEEYCQEFRRFIAYVPRYGVDLKFIAAGPNGGDIPWTRRFFTNMVEKGFNQLNSLWGWGLHYYAGTTGQGHPLEYTTAEWYDLIARADRIGTLIEQHWAVMGESDPQHRVKLAVDEWGAWHNQHESLPAGYLFGYPGTLRDALVAALSLDTFNRDADKVVMANVAQLINTIHSLFIAYEDKFVATPNFHVFEMYAAHQGGQSVRTVFSAPGVSFERPVRELPPNVAAHMTPQQRAAVAAQQTAAATLWGLQGSASLRNNRLTLTVVNPHASAARETEVVVRGRVVQSAKAWCCPPPTSTPTTASSSLARWSRSGLRWTSREAGSSTASPRRPSPACSSRWPDVRAASLAATAVTLAAGAFAAATAPEMLPVEGDVSPIHDPAIVRTADGYRVFASNRFAQKLVPMFCSPDRRRWTVCGNVFDAVPDWALDEVPGARGIWAPDIAQFRGKYLVYYSVSTFGKNRSVIGLVTNRTLDPASPDYRWVDEGKVVGSTEADDWNAIDANFAVDEHGQPWLAWGSFWGGIKMRRLDAETGKLSSADTTLHALASRRPLQPPAIEAPFLVRKGPYHYLFVSFDRCCRGKDSTYKVVVGRAEKITGPYTDRDGKPMMEGGGTLLLEGGGPWRGPGHPAVLFDREADLLVFHAYDASTGRPSLHMSTMVWEEGWPRVGRLD